jgi:hypothetical protein
MALPSTRLGAGLLFNRRGGLRSAFRRFDRPLFVCARVLLEQELSQVDSDEVCVQIHSRLSVVRSPPRWVRGKKSRNSARA